MSHENSCSWFLSLPYHFLRRLDVNMHWARGKVGLLRPKESVARFLSSMCSSSKFLRGNCSWKIDRLVEHDLWSDNDRLYFSRVEDVMPFFSLESNHMRKQWSLLQGQAWRSLPMPLCVPFVLCWKVTWRSTWYEWEFEHYLKKGSMTRMACIEEMKGLMLFPSYMVADPWKETAECWFERSMKFVLGGKRVLGLQVASSRLQPGKQLQ